MIKLFTVIRLSIFLALFSTPVFAETSGVGTVLLDANDEYTIFKTVKEHPISELRFHCEDVHHRLAGGWLKFGSAEFEVRTMTCKVTVKKAAANSAFSAFLEQVDAGNLVISNEG